MLLDTSFVIDLLRKDSKAVEKAFDLQKSQAPVYTSSITVFELWQGAEDLRNPEKRERIEVLLSSLGLFPFDLESAKEAGTIHSECYRLGHPIEPEDSMIAGIGKRHHQAILTKNIKHFERVKGLTVETY